MRDDIPPLVFEWTEEGALRPLPRFQKMADRHYVVGVHYRQSSREERSIASHRHYFACVHTAWENLPEQIAEEFPTTEHLRKYALIRTGFRNTTKYVAANATAAKELAALIRPLDEYAVVDVTGSVVSIHVAASQKVAAMGDKEFKVSKEKVLDYLADMTGTTVEQLSKSVKEDVK